MCVCVCVCLVFILLDYLWASWICNFTYATNFVKFSAIASSNIYFAPFSTSSPFGISIIHVTLFEIVPHEWVLYSFLFTLFDSVSSSQNLSSAMLSLLMSLLEAFIFVADFFFLWAFLLILSCNFHLYAEILIWSCKMSTLFIKPSNILIIINYNFLSDNSNICVIHTYSVWSQ